MKSLFLCVCVCEGYNNNILFPQSHMKPQKSHYAFFSAILQSRNKPCVLSGITLQHDSGELCHLLARDAPGRQSVSHSVLLDLGIK